jgi:hypothetical protein
MSHLTSFAVPSRRSFGSRLRLGTAPLIAPGEGEILLVGAGLDKDKSNTHIREKTAQDSFLKQRSRDDAKVVSKSN